MIQIEKLSKLTKMITIKKIHNGLIKSLKAPVGLEQIGRNTFQLATPFEFRDGDSIVCYIEISEEHIRFTDWGHTLMHISYDVDITSQTRKEALEHVLAIYDLEYNKGEIYTDCSIQEIGFVFRDFIQGLIRISDISLWKNTRNEQDN